ncbi:MAG: hypothetical protein RMJ00_06365 [Nitrososphaerota archaeon]|nr:hypothetical protein [Nitrososphaerota archaeon]
MNPPASAMYASSLRLDTVSVMLASPMKYATNRFLGFQYSSLGDPTWIILPPTHQSGLV